LTDCAGDQYTNRQKKSLIFYLKLLIYYQEDYGKIAECQFHATSHGKCVCDGIGGTCKRLLRRKSLQQTSDNLILTAKDVFGYCRNQISNVDFICVDQEAVNERTPSYEERFSDAKTVLGTRGYHTFCPGKVFGTLQMKVISVQVTFEQCEVYKRR